MNNYQHAKTAFAKYGVNTDKALEALAKIPVALHCWQGDDVIGFDHDGPLTGGIQTTGNYPGRTYGGPRKGDDACSRCEKNKRSRVLCYF